MTTISLFANDQLLTVVLKPKIASGDMNSVLLHVDFDSIWDRFTKSAVFFTSNDDTVYEMILTDGECTVPHEVLAESGTLFIGVRGVSADNFAIKTSTLVKYKIEDGAPVGDGTTIEPTPDIYQQILTRLNEIKGGGSGIHIGSEPPEDENVTVWIDTDEEPESSGADWNAKEGEPGYVLNRTHYENGTEMKTLFDQTITVANNAWQGSGIVNLVDGNTYTVVWDGTTYECVAFATVFNGANAIALGNPYLLGVGENNNQPFVFGWAYEYGMLASGSMTNGDHTIKITEEVKVYKKLDECYLPSGLMPYILKAFVSLSDGVPSTPLVNIGALFDIVAETLWNSGRVVLDFTGTELTNECIYKAEVVEWWFCPQTNGTNAIVLWYLYKGNPTSYSITGGTWTPPTT